MKHIWISILVLVSILVFSTTVLAQAGPGDSPLPTPTPPVPVPDINIPGLEDPTDLLKVLPWIAAGGAGPFVAVWIEKQKWFQAIESRYKPTVVMVTVASVALAAKLLIDFVPASVWAVIAPYFGIVVVAILIGYPLSQFTHRSVNVG